LEKKYQNKFLLEKMSCQIAAWKVIKKSVAIPMTQLPRAGQQKES
jgi:hypothetical protein